MPSFPWTAEDVRRVLTLLGIRSVDDLFAGLSPRVRESAALTFDFGAGVDGTSGLSELEVLRYVDRLAAANRAFAPGRFFAGGGLYDEPCPAVVTTIASRAQLAHAAMPLLPSRSQGALQALHEFQQLAGHVAGLPVVTVPHGDGATATVDAAYAATSASGGAGHGVLVAASVRPGVTGTLRTYFAPHPPLPATVRWNEDGTLDLEHLAELVKVYPAAVLVVGYPNRFGIVEPLEAIREALPAGVHLVAAVGDAMALSLFDAPGALGADLVAADAQPWGNPSAGGGVGFVAASEALAPYLPGWRVTARERASGERAYDADFPSGEPVELSAHLAGAVRAVAYLARLGGDGFAAAGERAHSLFDYLARELDGLGIPLRFPAARAGREGVFEVPNLDTRYRNAVAAGILPGLRFEAGLPADFSSSLLVCCHGASTREDVDALVEVLSHD